MTKYRALADVPPNISKGDVIEFNEPLVDSYKPLFERFVEGENEDTDLIVNPDRNALKERATELGLNFASNVPTEKLIAMIEEKEAEDKDEDEDDDKDEE